jgi:dienelactone hydrolase
MCLDCSRQSPSPNSRARIAPGTIALDDPNERPMRALSRDFLMSYAYLKLLMSDMQAASDYLHQLAFVRHDGLGLLGFCGGGVLNLLFAATHPGIQAVVAFY